MKKIVYLFISIAIISFNSCGNDDDGISVDPIVGTWFLDSENGEFVNECGAQSNIVFNDNGVANYSMFFEDAATLITSDGVSSEVFTCELDAFVFDWENTGDNIYSFFEVDDSFLSEQGDFVLADFSNNNQTLTLTFIDEEGFATDVITYNRQ